MKQIDFKGSVRPMNLAMVNADDPDLGGKDTIKDSHLTMISHRRGRVDSIHPTHSSNSFAFNVANLAFSSSVIPGNSSFSPSK